MVNTNHDTASYEKCSYKHEIPDLNVLYEAYLKAKQSSDWKPQVQKYETLWLNNITQTSHDLTDGSFDFLPSSKFTISERGKKRVIHGEQIHDRVVKHAVCDDVLTPAITKYLIYDNGASVKGKGISFTRKRLDVHLHRFYQKNKSNNGYILLIDFSKYYDNIRHDILMNQFRKYVKDDLTLQLLEMTLKRSEVDVSYMSDEEYSRCMDVVYNSLDYEKIDNSMFTGEKKMSKHLNIGDQISQIAGIIYPIPIDNYIKIVKGCKYYGRYMDDSYIIHEDKNFLISTLNEVIEIAKENGIFINPHKTRICKLSDTWKFLQIHYSLTESGRIIKRINPKRVTAMRKKMKKLAGAVPKDDFMHLFDSWWGNYKELMSHAQRANLKILYTNLLGVYK